jgi:uncharacterized membrane protein
MAVLILGLVVVLGTHSLKAFAPAWRLALVNRLGEGPYKGLYSAVSLIGLILIVWGFGLAWQDPTFVYTPPSWGRHVAMALMIPALILVFASVFPARWIGRYVSHRLLTATMLWSVAHLLANGDPASFCLPLSLSGLWSTASCTRRRASLMDRRRQGGRTTLPLPPVSPYMERWSAAFISGCSVSARSADIRREPKQERTEPCPPRS